MSLVTKSNGYGRVPAASIEADSIVLTWGPKKAHLV